MYNLAINEDFFPIGYLTNFFLAQVRKICFFFEKEDFSYFENLNQNHRISFKVFIHFFYFWSFDLLKFAHKKLPYPHKN